jgi:CheY-like chemotaxis protein
MLNPILIVDDEQDFLDSARRGLLGTGFKNLKLESDPRNAAASVENGEKFDVALIDINMPWMDGCSSWNGSRTRARTRNASWSPPSMRRKSPWNASKKGLTII